MKDLTVAKNMWYSAEDVQLLVGVAQTKAYEIMKKLGEELAEKGYAKPPSGKIQKNLFCEKFMLDREECDRLLKEYKDKKQSA